MTRAIANGVVLFVGAIALIGAVNYFDIPWWIGCPLGVTYGYFGSMIIRHDWMLGVGRNGK